MIAEVGRELGRSGLMVSPVCVGTSPLGSMPGLYGYEVDAAQAVETVRAVLRSPISFIDTSNAYGGGESERRIGEALARGPARDDLVVATKVDPDPETGDFSGARVRASVRESLGRLGLDRVPLLYLHDPERMRYEETIASDGPVRELVALREAGAVDRIGVASGDPGLLSRLLALDEFDVVLTHNRFTLLDQSAAPLLDAAAERGVGVVNAAPYGGGMLARGARHRAVYAYRRDDERIRSRAIAMDEVCDRHGVPLAAAALQFSLRDARIHATAVGVSSPERVTETMRLAGVALPSALWDELAPLIAAGQAMG